MHHLHINPLNAELNPICHLLALLGAHHILDVSGIRVKCDDTNRCSFRNVVFEGRQRKRTAIKRFVLCST